MFAYVHGYDRGDPPNTGGVNLGAVQTVLLDRRGDLVGALDVVALGVGLIRPALIFEGLTGWQSEFCRGDVILGEITACAPVLTAVDIASASLRVDALDRGLVGACGSPQPRHKAVTPAVGEWQRVLLEILDLVQADNVVDNLPLGLESVGD